MCIALLAVSAAPAAKTLRWASQGDLVTLDPHSFNEGLNRNLNNFVYEYLVVRDQARPDKLNPGLAVSWSNPTPQTWVFKLREGVKFHDGSAFTADDVVFSILRAREANAFRLFAHQAGVPRKIDDYTVEFTTPVPNPIMLDTLNSLSIMSKAWCEKNKAPLPQILAKNEVTFASRHAMGTGPYVVTSWEPGVRVGFRANPNWWGLKMGRMEGNVDAITYRPIGNAATRMAALKSGELDFVLDPSVQDIPRLRDDPGLKVWEGSENRLIFLAFDQERDQLPYSDVKGRNPFKDRRVRQALYQAIDINALKTQVMRGLSIPTAMPLPAGIDTGVPAAMDKRLSHDPAAAKRLLTEAGYPGGFGFSLLCPNDRYINDEKLCVALAAMWARVGVNVKVEAIPKAQFFPRLNRREVSAYLHGWGTASTHAIETFKPLFHSRTAQGAGSANFGAFTDAQLDLLIDRMESEMNLAERQSLIIRAVQLMQDEVYIIPLHRQVIPWASRRNVSVVHNSDNTLEPLWVRID
ncbi:MAG: ABC transporter substrate-binding protein [Betaproteobacteria bacterium]